MKSTPEYFEKIHDYLTGALDAPARAAFEAELEADAELRRDTEVERLLLEGIARQGDHAFRREITDAHAAQRAAGFFEKNAPSTSSKNHLTVVMKKVIAIAAAAVALFAVVWFAMPKGHSTDETFAQFYKPETSKLKSIRDDLRSHGMTGLPTPSDTIALALTAYEDGKYDQSIKLLDALLKDHPENDTATFYLGMSHLARERYARAIELLKPLSAKADFPLRGEATWYLALCYLKTPGGEKEAIELFESLTSVPEYENQARAVLSFYKK